jgi:catechol 2,3-dioxygenase-like lactoylglutathione lyase family enzyme
MFKRLMYTTLFVTDQAKALDFYTQAFGFEKRADNPGPEGRFLTIGLRGHDAEILLWPGTRGRPTEGTGAPPSSIPGPLILESDDLRTDVAALRSRGVRFVEPEPEDYPFGVRATALDPDGNRVSLRQTKRTLG